MPLNVVIELCKITKASKLFQRNFYLPLLEPLSPKDALRRHLIANEAQLHRMEHYIPVLEEYEKRQARRKLIVKGQVKKRQKKKASMKYVMPLLDMNMPGHSKLRNIFIRKSKGQGQCYTYRVPDKNCTLVITHQMERAIRDKDIIDVMVAQKNDKVVFVLKNNQKVSVPLVNYEGDAPFYRGDGWTNKEIESTHHYGKEHHYGKDTMAITHVLEGKEQKLEEWELDMMNMAALRKKKMKCEDTREWKALMSNQANYIDWELFESQAKQIVQEQYTPVEDQPISMKLSSMEDTMNVNEKLQKSGKAVIELLPAVADIPEIIKAMKDAGELAEVANVSGVKVKYMDKDYFVPGQMVKWEDSDLLVPGQTIFNENGDTEYVPGFTVATEGSPTLIPGLVVGDDPNKPIFLPGVSTITESGFLKFEETEDDLPQDLDKNSDDEEIEEKPVPPKQTVLESNIRTKRQIRELPDVVKDSETAVQALPLQDEGNGGNEAGDEMESENGDDIEDETESITSVIEVSQARIDTPTSIAGEEVDAIGQVVKEEGMMAYSQKTPTTEFLGAEKRALAEENQSISMQLAEGSEEYKIEEPNESMDQGDKTLNEDVTEKEKKGGNEKTKTTKTEGEKAEDEDSTKTLTSEFLVTEKGAIAEENPSISMPLDERKEDNKKEEPNEDMHQGDEELNAEVTEKEELKEGDNRKTKTNKTEGEKAEDGDSTKTSEFLVAGKGALVEENPSIPMPLDERKEKDKKEEPNENMEQGDEKLNEEVIGKEELKAEVNEKTITNNTEGEKTEEDKIGEQCDLMLEGGDPEPTSLSRIDAHVTTMEHPKDEENLANEATNENLATMMVQTTDIRLLVEQVSKVEDMKDQFVKVEIEDQSIQQHTENDQIEKGKQQTQKEQEANTSPKEQTHEVTIKKVSNERRENQEKLEVEQPREGLVAKEQEDANRMASDQMKLQQTALKHTAEKKLTKQAEKKEKANDRNIQSQTEKSRVLEEYTTHTEDLEDSASKMQQAKAQMENQALEKDNSDTQTVKVLVVYKDQVEEKLPKEKDSTSKQALEVSVSREQPDKTEMATHIDKKQAPEGSTVEKKVTINLPAKVFFEEILKNDNSNKQTVVNEEKDAEDTPDEKSSKGIKSWSTIVKELFEVSAVVAGCYFINQLGKNLFNISI